MPQAGEGGDYSEGCSTRCTACYKCGGKGHWAAECPGICVEAPVLPKPLLPFSYPM